MKVFLFILDGCASSEFESANTPFLDEISKAGEYTLECEAIFPTATYTGHSTIITGNYPEKHGMIGNQFWDRKYKCIRNFDFFNPNDNIESPTIFELLPFPSCAISEPVTKGAKMVIEKQIFDKITLENQNQSVFNHLTTKLSSDIQFYMINFLGVDGFGESAGPNSKKYLQCLEEVDELIMKIKNQIKTDFVFIVTADHGMTIVKENINLEEKLRNDGFDVKCMASHRCSHIYAESDLEALERHLQSLNFIDKIFDRGKIEEVHLAHERTGDIVVCAKIGYEFGDMKLNGSHGGATQAEILVPFIIYDSKNRLTGKVSLESMKLVDICPTILDLFNIKLNLQFQGKSLLI
ncbi:MAG: alkaline phosphatase family protein [Candidatus Helarchaeota archaeon]|nr:alkaline phosphatase family protein [Candidatus Helarchaeota archaeon]